jgi:hypothetical protein
MAWLDQGDRRVPDARHLSTRKTDNANQLRATILVAGSMLEIDVFFEQSKSSIIVYL